MNPNVLRSLFTLIIIGIATLFEVPTSSGQDGQRYDTCGQLFQCGNIENISYPFSGVNRPDYCGYPGFGLTCASDTLLLRYRSIPYRVLRIDYSAQAITVARNDLWDNSCPQNFLNTTFDFTLFNYYGGGDQNISLYYGCRFGPVPPIPSSTQFSCNLSGVTSNNVFVRTGTVPVELGRGLCTANVIVPVNQASAQTLDATPSESALRSGLRSGFGLEWMANNTLCDSCVRSGGRCGSDSPSPIFACYCADRAYPSICNETVNGIRDSSSGSSTTRNIVLPIVGAILAGIGIGWIFFFCRQRRKRRAAAKSAQTQIKDVPTPISTKTFVTNPSTNFTASIPSYPSSKLEFGRSTYFGAQVFTYEELEEATENFDNSKELGDGGFGTVYYGKLIDGREVAVKRLYENNFKRVEQFLNEVEILTKLSHKNLVKLYGCTSKRSRELLLVYEYISNGTVADHLHGKLANSSSSLLSWPIRLNIAIETADALTYLHESDIIHRDIKTNNILLDKNFRVKVADFGLSRLFPNDATHVSTAPQGTPGYVDPEYYQCYQLTDKSDVYSFGVVLIELISSLQAVDTNRHRHDINLANMAINKIQNHMLKDLVDESLGFETDGLVRRMTRLVAELAFRCLQQEKDMRPSMKEVLEILRGIQNEELNAQKAEVLDIVVDTAFPPSPDSGVTDKLMNSSTPNSSEKLIISSAPN